MVGQQNDNVPEKQPIPDMPQTGESSSSEVAPSAPAPESSTITHEQALTSPPSPERPPPPAGFVYPTAEIHNSAAVHAANVPAGPPPAHASAGPAPQIAAYDMPPPSYQAAMSYPAAPTYGGSDPKYYAGQPPIYAQPPQITQTRLPQPDGVTTSTVRVRGTGSNVIVHVQPGVPCRRCTVGVVTRQTDMCCLLCLIILTIFTFPFGLVFLCCVPCTVQNRCTNCNRLA
uniref:Membrane protein BRI3 n=1 Tax=Caenorhabditis japonica TaxID=281687 RepID=A0A8R1HLV5_CAEJA